MQTFSEPRDRVLEPERWPVVVGAMRAGLEQSIAMVAADPRLGLSTSKIFSRRFDLLWTEYSAGRDLDELRSDFVALLEGWSPLPVEARSRGVEVGVWLRAFGLEEHLPRWFDAFCQIEGKAGLTEWVLGGPDPWNPPMTVDPSKRKADELMAQKVEADPVGTADELAHHVKSRWYRNHTNSWWWNLHKYEDLDEEGGYYGYWSWEGAAIVLMTGVDDSALKDAKYYPYDLVHYLDSNN